jgi:predicted  nucleic acid-binding Zn-ribbon protein
MRGNAHRRAAAHSDTEGRIRRKAIETESLRSTLDIVNNQLKVVAEERAAAARDLKTAEKELTAVQSRVRKHESYNATKSAVAAVDAEIDRLRKKAAGLEKTVSAAENRASAARAALAAVEKERRDAQDALQRLPNEIRAARGQVTRMLGEVSTAPPDDAARVGAAQPALREALDSLREHARRTGDDLARSLVDTTALKKATARNEEEMERLSNAKAALAKTQAELQTRIEQRENDIRGRVLKNKPKHA